MKNFKLNIEMIPKGAWENNLRTTLSKKDWDFLREQCYKKANNHCQICGAATSELEAHEIWDFDIKNKTQTLRDIIGICKKCHGVIHYHNSERLGYGKQAKEHFMKVNKTSEIAFASHLAKALIDYEEKNKIYRWKINADLNKLGLKNVDIKQKNIPFIKNPYENVDWYSLTYNDIQNLFQIIRNKNIIGAPMVVSINVDNYQGTITIKSLFTDNIEWFLDDIKIQKKYNIIGLFTTKLKVENLQGKCLNFKLTGIGGETLSKPFVLLPQEVL